MKLKIATIELCILFVTIEFLLAGSKIKGETDPDPGGFSQMGCGK
jgi:hypothetical protein